MPLSLPPGKRLAVSIGSDFDAHSVWMGTFKSISQSHLSRGEFGAVVGVPRLLKLFDTHGIRTTWCTPTHTIQTFRAQCDQILEHGHEMAAHGVWHEPITQLAPAEERRLLELQIKQHEDLLGARPRGYRSPAWDVTDHTLALLEEYGFDWDSSLMGRDFEPYHPRIVTHVDEEHGNAFGPPSTLLEIPVSWYLDDFPPLENLPRSVGMQSTDTVLRRWLDQFTFAYERCPGGVFALTVHPQTIARAHHLMMFEAFLEHIIRHDGVWFATLSEIADAWAGQDSP
ncbi:polysaccharide deacetylase family protein [Streptomyces sp. GMR22]|uniref:polysaccharide deacetylase family protein n=1 Tax=Streptomyces sp. GMR22 TaxID=2759524 RepID=UPI0015FE3A1A|nr:polysaccharide deacetylase [Streptomyces sp. GMR22]MBA6440772.1 polysaccharide deacetylase [Streptomyces sp. GMR22]